MGSMDTTLVSPAASSSRMVSAPAPAWTASEKRRIKFSLGLRLTLRWRWGKELYRSRVGPTEGDGPTSTTTSNPALDAAKAADPTNTALSCTTTLYVLLTSRAAAVGVTTIIPLLSACIVTVAGTRAPDSQWPDGPQSSKETPPQAAALAGSRQWFAGWWASAKVTFSDQYSTTWWAMALTTSTCGAGMCPTTVPAKVVLNPHSC
mmetsp:Transcript_21549/g.48653  ORF Transcript_21549/g.48653 Transcript_21549/m.48653 type:complete len:205 (-) Transcript_21549:2042-2656(-)